MQVEKVPIDMASEQKEILGLASKRQIIYLAAGGIVLYSYVPLVYKIFAGLGWIVGALFALVSAIPVIALILFFGFTKVEKFNMNRDYYILMRLQKHTQYGSWRK
ncbi:PrgI family mobile element protein [Cytobacillus gottheilii]|uniref:PrgI family mobile element protein n=1 Tax=Cytobacillus gottheilii TaxID=859144 RepID=UPI0024949D25|nr:PrgI family protein [Cytobacillus gottheilii]